MSAQTKRRRQTVAELYREGEAARLAGERPSDHRLYRVPWVAGYLDVHPDSVYRMIAQDRLRGTRVGPREGTTLVLGRDLNQYIEGT